MVQRLLAFALLLLGVALFVEARQTAGTQFVASFVSGALTGEGFFRLVLKGGANDK